MCDPWPNRHLAQSTHPSLGVVPCVVSRFPLKLLRNEICSLLKRRTEQAGKPSSLKPVSNEVISVLRLLCENDVRFLHIQEFCKSGCSPKMVNLPPELIWNLAGLLRTMRRTGAQVVIFDFLSNKALLAIIFANNV